MWKLGLLSHNSFSGYFFYEFSVLVLCSVWVVLVRELYLVVFRSQKPDIRKEDAIFIKIVQSTYAVAEMSDIILIAFKSKITFAFRWNHRTLTIFECQNRIS
jgi:hypothetical protein